MCPTIRREDGYRFFFYSNEGSEPPHIHVAKGEGHAKLWLRPVRIAWARGFRPSDMSRIRYIVERNEAAFLEAWDDYRSRD
jgi:hypothetical protein